MCFHFGGVYQIALLYVSINTANIIAYFQTLQGRCDQCQQNNTDTTTRGESWKPTPVPQELLTDYPAEFKLQLVEDEIDGVAVHPSLEKHFISLAEQIAMLQEHLNKREDQLDKNEETVLIFKGLAEELLSWINQQTILPVMNKLPDANLEQLEDDISIIQVSSITTSKYIGRSCCVYAHKLVKIPCLMMWIIKLVRYCSIDEAEVGNALSAT